LGRDRSGAEQRVDAEVRAYLRYGELARHDRLDTILLAEGDHRIGVEPVAPDGAERLIPRSEVHDPDESLVAPRRLGEPSRR